MRLPRGMFSGRMGLLSFDAPDIEDRRVVEVNLSTINYPRTIWMKIMLKWEKLLVSLLWT